MFFFIVLAQDLYIGGKPISKYYKHRLYYTLFKVRRGCCSRLIRKVHNLGANTKVLKIGKTKSDAVLSYS